MIDTDAGTDDAWAIFLCLAAHRNPSIPFRIVGITTTHGNCKVDNVTVNVTRILETAQEANVSFKYSIKCVNTYICNLMNIQALDS